MTYDSKGYASSVIDDKTELLRDQYKLKEKERSRIRELERYKKYGSKLLLLYAFVIILALCISIYEFQYQEWEIFTLSVLIALTYAVMAIGYYRGLRKTI